MTVSSVNPFKPNEEQDVNIKNPTVAKPQDINIYENATTQRTNTPATQDGNIGLVSQEALDNDADMGLSIQRTTTPKTYTVTSDPKTATPQPSKPNAPASSIGDSEFVRANNIKTFHSSNADNFDEVWEYDREGRMIYAKYYDAGGPGHQGVYEGHAEDITDSNYCFVENHSRPGCEDIEVVVTKYARFNGGNWIKLPQRGSYEVDEKGNLIWESDGYLPETVRTYKYDEKNRIVEETHSYGTAENGFSDTYTYTYEENGTNGLVSKMIWNTSSYSYVYEYEYDEYGNMVKENVDNVYTVIYEYEEY